MKPPPIEHLTVKDITDNSARLEWIISPLITNHPLGKTISFMSDSNVHIVVSAGLTFMLKHRSTDYKSNWTMVANLTDTQYTVNALPYGFAK